MKTLSEQIKVMQAALRGEEIQRIYLANGNIWHRFDDIDNCFNWAAYDYRVKPAVPREWWINPRTGSIKLLRAGPVYDWDIDGIHVKEVL